MSVGVTAEGSETPVRVMSTCRTQARFVALFCRYFDGDRMWILTREAKAEGVVLSVEMNLSDGSTVLTFSGKVLESSTANGTPYGRPGMLVQITSVPPASRGVMHLLHMASAEWGRQTRVAVDDVPSPVGADPDGTATVTVAMDPTEAPDPNAPGYLPLPLPPTPPAGDPEDEPTQAVTDVPLAEFPEQLTARGKAGFRESATIETRVEKPRRPALTPEEAALGAETNEITRSRAAPDTMPEPLAPLLEPPTSPPHPAPPPMPPGGYWQPGPGMRSTGAMPPLRYPFMHRAVRMPTVLAVAGGAFLFGLLIGLAIG